MVNKRDYVGTISSIALEVLDVVMTCVMLVHFYFHIKFLFRVQVCNHPQALQRLNRSTSGVFFEVKSKSSRRLKKINLILKIKVKSSRREKKAGKILQQSGIPGKDKATSDTFAALKFSPPISLSL
jgi:hypothetical protein